VENPQKYAANAKTQYAPAAAIIAKKLITIHQNLPAYRQPGNNMADYEMKDGTFNLFKADKKNNENYPDYTGKIKIEGRELRLAAWIKSKDGKAYFSGKVSEFQERSNEPVEDPLNPPNSTPGPLEDDSPGPERKNAPREMLPDAEPLPF
jgi:hypothetical protein